MRLAMWVPLIIAVCAPAVPGQNLSESKPADEGPQEFKFRAHSDLILLPTRIEKKNGDTIYGLRPDQFVVEDDGVRHKVHIEESPDSLGLSLVVVVQCSKSAMTQFNKLKGLGTMIEAITGGAHHQVAVVSYGEKPYLLGDFSPRSEATRSALSRIKDCGDYHAATIDAVAYAIDLLKGRKDTFKACHPPDRGNAGSWQPRSAE